MANEFNRFGYDKDGYNKDGYNRIGYNREGYDKDGFDMSGYNKKGINKITGRDKDGYDANGMDIRGYDREGYDKDGYNENGFDRSGYDREGFNEHGWTVDGFNRDGFDISGYDRQGYDINGLDHKGFNRQGYDSEGFDISGYDCEGYGRDGFDRQGYNKSGYNQSGFDREGYDRTGFNIEGYNRDGFDRNGFNINGFDINGYDKDGYNAKGFNEQGYDREGYDEYGFNQEGLNREGYSYSGYNKEGFNLYGYDKKGFNHKGESIDGFPISSFDDEGYHLFTGFNTKGRNREGFSINGYDSDGYDKEGYHNVTGLNRKGYNRQGYNRSGYDAYGYDKEGYNLEGYNRAGFNRAGYDKEGYDEEGYDKNGYDRNGFDSNGYNEKGEQRLSKEKQKNGQDLSNEDVLEKQYFYKCCLEIRGPYRSALEKEIYSEYQPIEREYIDKWGFLQKYTIEPNMEAAERKVRLAVEKVLSEPYFAHVNYKDDAELYIGKTKVNGWVTDWADKRASYYYQYQMYIGDPKTELEYVRSIIIKDRNYEGYKELFKRYANKEEVLKVADERLQQIIKANRKNKSVHDIIETIQKNQYKIITSDKDKNLLVLGCAGSGKTMILMHRIRYIKYNNPEVDMNRFIIISPTNLLLKENNELSRLLQVDKVNNYTTAEFYKTVLNTYLSNNNLEFDDYKIDEWSEDKREQYSEEFLEDIYEKVRRIITRPDLTETKEFFKKETSLIKEIEGLYEAKLRESKTPVSIIRLDYDYAIKEINSVGRKDVVSVIREIERVLITKKSIEDYREIAEFLLKTGVFVSKKNQKRNNKESIESLFFYTQRLIDRVDVEEFVHVLSVHNIEYQDMSDVFLALQSYCDVPLDDTEGKKLLKEWKQISLELIDEYLKDTDRRLQLIAHLDAKRKILQELLETGVFHEKQETVQLSVTSAFEKTMSFYEATKDVISNNIMDSLQWFFEYNKVRRKKQRLFKQRDGQGENQYLFDAVKSLLEIDEGRSLQASLTLSDAFVCVYVFTKWFGPITSVRKYVYVDEFQNYSPIELLTIKKVFKSATVNLFGDVNQRVNKKGIPKLEAIPKELYSEKHEINENYRNAAEITEYINKKVKLKMMAVGLSGIAKEMTALPDISIQDDDRVALIMKDGVDVEYSFNTKVNYYLDSHDILRGCINIIPVSKVNGLEFEKAIVVMKNMTYAEFYVAATRAISELYVITAPKSGITKTQKESQNPISTKSISKSEEDITKYNGNNAFQGNSLIMNEGRHTYVYIRTKRTNKKVRCSFCNKFIRDDSCFTRGESVMCLTCIEQRRNGKGYYI